MAGPWTQYQSPGSGAPWTKYQKQKPSPDKGGGAGDLISQMATGGATSAATGGEGFLSRLWQGIQGKDVSGAGRLGMGMADPVYGGARVGALMPPSGEGTPAEAFTDKPPDQAAGRAAVEKTVSDREKAYQQGRQAVGQKGFDWQRFWGNLVSPVTAATVAAVPESAGVPLAARVGLGAVRGGLIGAEQPTGNIARNVATGAAMGAPLEGVAGAGIRTAPQTARNVADLYRRSIKPTNQGTSSLERSNQIQAQAQDAVGAIIENKPNLHYGSPETGDVSMGHLPQSMEQFLQATAQTKQKIFKQYDTLAKQAGEQGATVDLEPLAKELDEFAADPVNKDSFPQAVRYAHQQAKIYRKRGQYTTEQAQGLVQKMNAELRGSYSSDKPVAVGSTLVNRLIANKIRGELDNTISRATGEEYQALKNQYGALRNTEGAVTKRLMVYARQNPGGGLVGNLFDVQSAADVARWLAAAKTGGLSEAVANQLIKRLMFWNRSPDTMIRRMFQQAERPASSAPRRLIPQAAATAGQVSASPAIRYNWPQQ